MFIRFKKENDTFFLSGVFHKDIIVGIYLIGISSLPAQKREISMAIKLNGELVPVGGGDSIPLIRPLLTVGRRDSCDICMRYPNISGLHCELSFREGYWFIRDLNSTNGVKVNGARVQEKLLYPNDEISIGKRLYTIEYEMPAGKIVEREEEDVFSQSLLEKAGLEKPRDKQRPRPSSSQKRQSTGRNFDPADFLLEDD